jgi:hypothetical protein
MLTWAEDAFLESPVTRNMSCSVHRFDPVGGRTMAMLEQLHVRSLEVSLLLTVGLW